MLALNPDCRLVLPVTQFFYEPRSIDYRMAYNLKLPMQSFLSVEHGVAFAGLRERVMSGASGSIELRVTGLEPEQFKQFENALVRVRGCMLASWDYQTHQFRPGVARIYEESGHAHHP